jgi:glycogen operon protein
MWRNGILMLFLGQGVPLIWSGDEMCNSQDGNNNAYCQDNPVGWLNWKNEKNHSRELQFFRQVIAFRREHPILAHDMPFQFSDYKAVGSPDLSYHGENAWVLEPQDGHMALGMMYCGDYEKDDDQDASQVQDIYVAYNFSSAATTLALPEAPGGRQWFPVIDTSCEAQPFVKDPEAYTQNRILVKSQAILVLVSKKPLEKQKPVKAGKAKAGAKSGSTEATETSKKSESTEVAETAEKSESTEAADAVDRN